MSIGVILKAVMNKRNKRAPGSLSRAVSDLVAEGGNEIASDEVPGSDRGTTQVPVPRLRPSRSGRRIARAPKA
jgi:hypothetical protein